MAPVCTYKYKYSWFKLSSGCGKRTLKASCQTDRQTSKNKNNYHLNATSLNFRPWFILLGLNYNTNYIINEDSLKLPNRILKKRGTRCKISLK